MRYKRTEYTIKTVERGKKRVYVASISDQLVQREFTNFLAAQKLVHSIIDKRQKTG